MVLQIALAVSACYGAVGLVLQLQSFTMPVSWLAPLPLHSWVLPGVALFAGVAVPLAVAAYAEVRDAPHAVALAWLACAALVGWLVLQLLVIGLRAPVQVVTLVLAAALVVLTRQSTRTTT